MRQLFQLDCAELDAVAERYFQYTCGLRGNAYTSRAKIYGRLDVRAITRAFCREALAESGLLIEGHAFPCQDLARLDKRRLHAVYAFVLTTGELRGDELRNEKQSLPDTFFAGLWGAAYINAASKALRKQLSLNHQKPVYISEPIAPGYYDMGAEKIVELLQIIDAAEIGVTLQGKTLTPLTSCAGFFLAVEDKRQVSFLDKRCLYCPKESGGCAFCAYQKSEVR